MDVQPIGRVAWVRMLPFLGFHLACVAIIWVGISWTAVLTAIGLYGFRMFAITGFYHRYFSHRTFKTSRGMQLMFGILGASAMQRGPIWWAAHHRHHHMYADTLADVHSPVQYGFLWSHMGWFMSPAQFTPDLARVQDLTRYPELRLLDRIDVLIPSLLGSALFSVGMVLKHHAPQLGTTGAQLLVWGFVVSTVLLYHGTYTINSLSHVWGRQRYQTDDASRNNPWLAIVTMGEGWHNNHHHYPAATRQGFFWWEWDPTFYVLKMLSWTGLVWDLHAVPRRVRDDARGTVRSTASRDGTVPD